MIQQTPIHAAPPPEFVTTTVLPSSTVTNPMQTQSKPILYPLAANTRLPNRTITLQPKDPTNRPHQLVVHSYPKVTPQQPLLVTSPPQSQAFVARNQPLGGLPTVHVNIPSKSQNFPSTFSSSPFDCASTNVQQRRSYLVQKGTTPSVGKDFCKDCVKAAEKDKVEALVDENLRLQVR